MLRTGDIRLVRQVNEKFILNLIRTKKLISGAEISVITGLRPSTVLNILNVLESKNIIIKQGKGDSTSRGGKKPTLWRLNKSAFYTIGVDVEVNEIKTVILDLNGDTIAQSSVQISEDKNVVSIKNQLTNIVKDILKDNQIENNKVLGMGIAFAGVIDTNNGLVIKGDIFQEMNVPFLHELKKEFNFNMVLENNANAVALGEKWLGKAIDKKNFMVILLEFDTKVGGIGIGIVINNELYRGSTFCAGELNQRLPNIIELLENLRHKIPESTYFSKYENNLESINISTIIDALKNNDKLALNLINYFGNFVGKLISKSVALLNPETVIISGPLSQLNHLIINPIKEAIDLEILSIASQNLEIICSEQGEFSVPIGAASLILSDFFNLTPKI